MNKVRSTLAAIALLVTLSGPFLPAAGSALMTNVAASQHVSSSFVVGKAAKSDRPHPYPYCPVPGGNDC